MGLFDNSIKEYKNLNENIHLIDATNMFCRSALIQYKGQEIDFSIRVANFVKMFSKANRSRPKYCAAVFDSSRRNFRHDLYADYKANRSKTYIKDEKKLLKTVKRILHYSGFTVLGSDNYEADDIIGALSRLATKKNRVIIHSEDKDFVQLINENVTLLKGGILYDERMVKLKYGVSPSQFVEYLALIGDSIDNIPGIKLWGPKTAVEYLNKYGCIANIQKQDLRQSLCNIKDEKKVALYKKLVTIKKNIKVINSLDDIVIGKRNFEKLSELSQKHKLFIGDIYG